MPHKHRRREKDDSTYDLPPTVIAKSLPARDPKSTRANSNKKQKKTNAPKTNAERFETKIKNDIDDTPKAFKRLMQFQTSRGNKQQPPSGLDTGENRKRKRDVMDGGKEESTGKKKAAATATAEPATARSEIPKILPGEKLSDFAARVDRELPLSTMTKSGKPAGLEGISERKRTKHEKRLRRLQRGWREEEAKIREREEEEREEREEDMEEELQLWKQWENEAGTKKKKKGPAKKRGNGADPDDDPDPWAKLNKRDRTERPANPFDVVQAPPQLTKPKQKFKVRDGAKVDVADVPAAVGSLRRREELAGERRTIVEEYRRLMAEKRK